MEADSIQKVTEELDFEINNWRKSLRRMSSEVPRELERKDPIQLLEVVLQLSLKFFPSHLKSRLTTFINMFVENAGLRKLFLFALYEGVYGVQKLAQEASLPSRPDNTSSIPLPVQQIVYRSQSE